MTPIEKSHRDPIFDVRFIQSKTGKQILKVDFPWQKNLWVKFLLMLTIKKKLCCSDNKTKNPFRTHFDCNYSKHYGLMHILSSMFLVPQWLLRWGWCTLGLISLRTLSLSRGTLIWYHDIIIMIHIHIPGVLKHNFMFCLYFPLIWYPCFVIK